MRSGPSWRLDPLPAKEGKTVKMPDRTKLVGKGKPHAPVEGPLKVRPNLAGFLTDSTYEGGVNPREAGTVNFRAFAGAWSVTLRDPSSGTMIRLQVETLENLLDALEAVLSGKHVPWETDNFAKGVKRGK